MVIITTPPLSCPPEGESAFTCEQAARTKGRGNAGEQQLYTSHPSTHTKSGVCALRMLESRTREMDGVHGRDKACKSAMMRPASGEAENAQRERVGIAELSTFLIAFFPSVRRVVASTPTARRRAC